MADKHLVFVVGARPNFMKVAPIMAALRAYPTVTQRLVHTGQHYDDALSAAMLRDLDLRPFDVELGVGSGSRAFQIAETVRRLDLPEKLLVIHQFTEDMVSERERLRDRPGVATVINVDGFGDQANKIAKYRELRPEAGWLGSGFKLFYNEDLDLMSPERVLGLKPKPDLIVYE